MSLYRELIDADGSRSGFAQSSTFHDFLRCGFNRFNNSLVSGHPRVKVSRRRFRATRVAHAARPRQQSAPADSRRCVSDLVF
jgi:hypothetical protein